MYSRNYRKIANFKILVTSAEELSADLLGRVERRTKSILLFANTNFVVKCSRFSSILNHQETVLINDGIGMDLASLLLHGRFFPENLNGTDFIPKLLGSFKQPVKVFLLGSEQAVADKAALALSATYPGVQVVGVNDGFESLKNRSALITRINATQPDVLLVGMGNPLQEKWILENRDALDVPLMIGVGALFEFLSGATRRAPWLMRKTKLEWLHRLMLDPRRLMRRYTLDIIQFLSLCFKYRSVSDHSARSSN